MSRQGQHIYSNADYRNTKSPFRDDIKRIVTVANTFTQIYLQFVFAVQDRISLIGQKWKNELYQYISGIVRNNNHKLIAINGTANHLHVFIGYKPHQLIPGLLKDIKGGSSKWINEKGFVMGKFRWQTGYGALIFRP